MEGVALREAGSIVGLLAFLAVVVVLWLWGLVDAHRAVRKTEREYARYQARCKAIGRDRRWHKELDEDGNSL